jgi:hypothetical protein
MQTTIADGGEGDEEGEESRFATDGGEVDDADGDGADDANIDTDADDSSADTDTVEN